jgi:hypothetical protein
MNELLKDRINRVYYENTIIKYNVAILDVDIIDDLLRKLPVIYSAKLRFIRHFYWDYRNEYIFSHDNPKIINEKKYVLLKKLEKMPAYVKTTMENSCVGFIDEIINYLKSKNKLSMSDLEENPKIIEEYWE